MRKTAVFLFMLISSSVFSFFPRAADAAVFEIYLKYDAGTDRLDLDESRGSALSVDEYGNIPISEFSNAPETGNYEYVFFDNTGNIVDDRLFRPEDGLFVLEIPYYSTAVSFAVRKKGIPEPILTVDISALSSCDNDGICEFEAGENGYTCLPDCASGKTIYSEGTTRMLERGGGVIRDDVTGEILLGSLPDVTIPGDDTAPGDSSDVSSGNLDAIGGVPGLIVVIVVFGIVVAGTVVAIRKRT